LLNQLRTGTIFRERSEEEEEEEECEGKGNVVPVLT
jgi:hypothetical protein